MCGIVDVIVDVMYRNPFRLMFVEQLEMYMASGYCVSLNCFLYPSVLPVEWSGARQWCAELPLRC